MNRRQFIAGGGCCAACLALGRAHAQSAVWQAPQRFYRPDIATDEGGLWALMAREEARLSRSPFLLKDARLHDYIQGIACSLGGEHCPDIRVHLVRTPLFNASMAPNGMMQIWTGLLLRVDNEAQLAAVIGHEIGHYLERHSLERLRDTKSRAAFGQFMGLFGAIGAIGTLAALAGAFAYSREQESAADRIGAILMRKAGYDVAEAARVWENMLVELKAKQGENWDNSPMFAFHPPAAERQAALHRFAEDEKGGVARQAEWQTMVRPFMRDWLGEEIKRGQHEESLALFARLMARSPESPDFPFARGEVRRLRAKDGDLDAALDDYRKAVSLGAEPAETHRGMGLIHRVRANSSQARISFQRYLDLAPTAADSDLIKSYLEELPA